MKSLNSLATANVPFVNSLFAKANCSLVNVCLFATHKALTDCELPYNIGVAASLNIFLPIPGTVQMSCNSEPKQLVFSKNGKWFNNAP